MNAKTGTSSPPVRVLVTGSTGQIGSELVPALRRRYGKENVVSGYYPEPVNLPTDSGPSEYLDATDNAEVHDVVKEYRIDTIYHLGGVLSAAGEKHPSVAWRVNVEGLHNILEAARDIDGARVFWPSSIAVFGADVPRDSVPQETPLVPVTIYGITKVAGELLCNYYSARYGVDVRSLRYPGIISSETPPGGGTTDYAVEMFYRAIERKQYTCFVRKDTVLPMLYMPDCIRATLELMEADPSRLTLRTGYNLGGLRFSAEELAEEIRKHIPDFVCDFNPDFRQRIADSWPRSLDDGLARRDWGWMPSYDLASMVNDMVKNLSRKLARPET